jgi:hypothetical protein
MVTVFAEIESIEVEEAGAEVEAAGAEQPLGPSDVVPIQYSAVPGTTTNVPGSHAYPRDQEGKVGVPTLVGAAATIKVKLAEPHSGSFEVKVHGIPASTVAVGRCRLMLGEA